METAIRFDHQSKTYLVKIRVGSNPEEGSLTISWQRSFSYLRIKDSTRDTHVKVHHRVEDSVSVLELWSVSRLYYVYVIIRNLSADCYSETLKVSTIKITLSLLVTRSCLSFISNFVNSLEFDTTQDWELKLMAKISISTEKVTSNSFLLPDQSFCNSE